MYRYMHTYIHMNRKQAGHQGQMRRRLRSARGRRQPRARAALSLTFLPVRPQRRSPARPRKAAVSSGRGRLTVAGSNGRGRRGGASECPTWSKPVAPLRASCRNDRANLVAIKVKEGGWGRGRCSEAWEGEKERKRGRERARIACKRAHCIQEGKCALEERNHAPASRQPLGAKCRGGCTMRDTVGREGAFSLSLLVVVETSHGLH